MYKFIVTGEYNSSEPITKEEYEKLINCLALCGVNKVGIQLEDNDMQEEE